MRTYYASDKKRREEAKRKQQEQKRLKRMRAKGAPGSESASDEKVVKEEGATESSAELQEKS